MLPASNGIVKMFKFIISKRISDNKYEHLSSAFEKKNQFSQYVQKWKTNFVESIKTSIIAKKSLAFSENEG